MQAKKQTWFPFTWRDLGICMGILAAAALGSALLHTMSDGDQYATMLFTFAVFLIARFTEGYLFGALGAILAVVYVNFAFTYPYYAFNFTIPGYPLTFITMLTVSLITSALTTQVKQQQAVWLRAQKETMRANLLRAVSHDLRTPLTSIVGALSAVLENPDTLDPQAQRDLLSNARGDAQWLIRMVENLLSVTRLDGDNQITKTQELVEEVVGEAVQKFRHRSPNIDIQVSVPEEPLLVPMDPILVEQVLTNLLDNTVQHAQATQAWLTVTQTGDFVTFSLLDNGTGLRPEVLPLLFDGEGLARQELRGSAGIGLAVCKTIVTAHGGTLSGENSPSGGALFRFTLPRA